MKMNRRFAVGSILGGIFGGPSIAKDIPTGLNNLIYGDGPSDVGTGAWNNSTGNEVQIDSDFKERELGNLRKIANGDLADWQIENIENACNDMHDYRNIEALRSVSDSAKVEMRKSVYRKRMKEHYIKEAVKRIASNLKLWGMKVS